MSKAEFHRLCCDAVALGRVKLKKGPTWSLVEQHWLRKELLTDLMSFFWQNWGEPCSISGISIEKLENQLIQLKATFSEKEKMLENLKTR